MQSGSAIITRVQIVFGKRKSGDRRPFHELNFCRHRNRARHVTHQPGISLAGCAENDSGIRGWPRSNNPVQLLVAPLVHPVLLNFLHLAQHCMPSCTDAFASVYSMPTGLTGARSSVKPVQLSLHSFVQLVAAIIFIMLWRLDGGLDLAFGWWIGHGVSTVNWICWIISIGPKNPTNMITQNF